MQQDRDLIQTHADAIQTALLNAHEALQWIQNEGLRDQACRALTVTHDVAEGAFRKLKRLYPERTDGVELRSGGGK